MEYFKLNNGIQIPALGFGVFRMTDLEACEQAVLGALEAGYRYIDTASAYENEEAVGRAIKKSGIPREKLFICTKLWITDTSYSKAKEAFNRSLDRLGLDYIDLYLIHQPFNDYYGAYQALEELYHEGKVKAIGVDNFTQEKLADLIFFKDTVPMVNYVETNVLYQRESDLKYMQSKNVQMAAWSPFGAGKSNVLHNDVIVDMAKRYNVKPTQIVLRWLFQRGIVSLSKGTSIEHIQQNIDIFNFELNQNDMALIGSLDTGESVFTPRDTGEAVELFLNASLEYNI